MRVDERDRGSAAGPGAGLAGGRLTCGRCGHRHLSVNPRIAFELGVRCKQCGGALVLERLRCSDCGEAHAGIDPDAALDADVRCFQCSGELAWQAEGRFVGSRPSGGLEHAEGDAPADDGAAEATPAAAR